MGPTCHIFSQSFYVLMPIWDGEINCFEVKLHIFTSWNTPVQKERNFAIVNKVQYEVQLCQLKPSAAFLIPTFFFFGFYSGPRRSKVFWDAFIRFLQNLYTSRRKCTIACRNPLLWDSKRCENVKSRPKIWQVGSANQIEPYRCVSKKCQDVLFFRYGCIKMWKCAISLQNIFFVHLESVWRRENFSWKCDRWFQQVPLYRTGSFVTITKFSCSCAVVVPRCYERCAISL